MGAIISLPFTILNLLLPFTRSGTPLSQDLLHTAILCGTLYFAPQIGEWYNAQRQAAEAGSGQREDNEDANRAVEPAIRNQEDAQEQEQGEQLPLDERLVLQDDGTEAARPPRAPTPPPHQAHVADLPELHHPQRHNHEEREVQLPDDAFAPGPANPPPQQNANRPPPTQRVVGTKKAKSLARKDQQRAYNEWLRSEAEMRRLQEAEGREEREAASAAEKARRAAVEEEIRERARQEREERKAEEKREAELEAARRERVVAFVREKMRQKGAVDLVDAAWNEGKDRLWVERLVKASGLMQQLQKEGGHVMITGQDWLVRIDSDIMEKAYAEAEQIGERSGGKVSFEEFGGIVERAVLGRAAA
ncbi:unnamed protein product [Alternaria alternata]|jgi:hypothetical protein|uniref:Uncharacterized protein n=2 Tax=Alternaria alternata complex TaxID=187734 RepID=A0A4Q4NL03_ALTAL|nr:hypothetical protein B0T12DRAFT_402652 [Alternaria alternata]RYN32523.1 hypothetical protein AA0115_g3597 [Alternaria tenuissima]OWY42436.1 hypothetical protein AALT_g9659 [Alternaria alternata]RYN78513.1 hypothetical protein AA0117_g4402 [Alternaria alternata]RYO06100.1 hypothetical protein AA0119_g2864 [Alternaria tenuissima]